MAARKPLVIIDGQIQELPSGDSTLSQSLGSTGGTDPIVANFSGTVLAQASTSRYYHPSNTTIVAAYASVGTASVSGDITVDIKINGNSILTEYLTVPSGEHLSPQLILSSPLNVGSYLTIDIVGAGTDAQNLSVYVVVSANNIPALDVLTGTYRGALSTGFTTSRYYPPTTITLVNIYASIGTPSTSDIEFDMLLDGVSLFPGAKPKILAGQHRSSDYYVSVAVEPTNYLTTAIVTAVNGYDMVIFAQHINTAQNRDLFIGNFPGALTEGTVYSRLYPATDIALTKVYATLGTVSSDDVVFDVLVGGISCFGSSKPSIPAGQHTSSHYIMSTAIHATEYITLAIVNAVDGADMAVMLEYQASAQPTDDVYDYGLISTSVTEISDCGTLV